MDPKYKHKLGVKGEEIAINFLLGKQYKILQQRYRCPDGEIDIVAEKDSILVFVEVKCRTSRKFGLPEEAVTPKKRDKLRKTVDYYLHEKNVRDSICRIDLIAIEIPQFGATPIIRHHENAVGGWD